MDKITPYKSIKKEAEGRKFSRFKQVDRARVGEDLGEEAQGILEEEGRRGEKADAIKGTCQGVKIVGEDRSEWKRGREKSNGQADGIGKIWGKEHTNYSVIFYWVSLVEAPHTSWCRYLTGLTLVLALVPDNRTALSQAPDT